MNEDMEKKLDQLLAEMPKREYDLDAWLAEDETAEFDRIVSEQRASSGMIVLKASSVRFGAGWPQQPVSY